jgi:hypothetical protein
MTKIGVGMLNTPEKTEAYFRNRQQRLVEQYRHKLKKIDQWYAEQCHYLEDEKMTKLRSLDYPEIWAEICLGDSVNIEGIFWPTRSIVWLVTDTSDLYFSNNAGLTFDKSYVSLQLFNFVHQKNRYIWPWWFMAKFHYIIKFCHKIY